MHSLTPHGSFCGFVTRRPCSEIQEKHVMCKAFRVAFKPMSKAQLIYWNLYSSIEWKLTTWNRGQRIEIPFREEDGNQGSSTYLFRDDPASHLNIIGWLVKSISVELTHKGKQYRLIIGSPNLVNSDTGAVSSNFLIKSGEIYAKLYAKFHAEFYAGF